MTWTKWFQDQSPLRLLLICLEHKCSRSAALQKYVPGSSFTFVENSTELMAASCSQRASCLGRPIFPPAPLRVEMVHCLQSLGTIIRATHFMSVPKKEQSRCLGHVAAVIND